MTEEKSRYVHRDSPEDVAMQEEIKSAARWSLFLLGKSFERHCGRFIWLGPSPEETVPTKRVSQKN